MTHNHRLREKRIRRSWRQEDLAEHLGISVTTVQRWERGSQHPTLYYRVKLCELFETSAQELGLLDDAPPPDTSPSLDPPPIAEDHALWTIPYQRNPHFTGREDLLAALEQHFASSLPTSNSNRRAALPLAYALKGLGGIGKTQTALEYAYRSHEQGRYRHTLWMTATSEEALLASFAVLREQISLETVPGTDQQIWARHVIRWLEHCHDPWLLIMDNADDLSFLSSYLPARGCGSILLTTRSNAVGPLGSSVQMDPLSLEEGIQLLLRRIQRETSATVETRVQAGKIVAALGQLPLALDQAGAYIEETGCSLQEYLHLSQEQQDALLARRGTHTVGYADSVATTWSLSFERIEQSNQAAAEFLQLCAFVAPDQLPEEVLTQGAAFWPAALQEAARDRWRFNQLLETVQAFSLVQRFGEERLLRLHRLVQVVQQARMDKRDQKQWAERLVQAVHALLPADARIEIESWPQCQRVVEQAKNCDQLIRQYGFQQEEAIVVLERTGIYLRERGRFAQAEQLLLHALRLREQQGRPQVLPMATLLLNLANLSSQQGKGQEAEAFCQQALQIRQHHLGPEHLDVALALHWLANIITNQGRLTQAERLYVQALQIREEQLGPEHPLVATSLLGLSLVYERQKQYTQAEVLTMRALRIREQQFGSDHPQTILALNGLAVIYAHQDKDEQAEPLYLRSLHIQEHLWGVDHPQLASPLDGLARIYAHQGKDEQAEALYLRALRILEQQSLTEHLYLAFPISGLATLYAHQGKDEQAEALYLRALRIREHHLGAQHLETADTLYELARFRHTQGRFSEARLLYLRVLPIRQEQLGSNHPLTKETQTSLQALNQAKNASH